MTELYRAGYVAIVGRPNVGKSTLLNCILEQKISITSKKRQTTRQNIVGIKSDPDKRSQIIFVDTPGMHQGEDNAMNRYMNRSASSALQDVDVVVFVVEKNTFTKEDEAVAAQVSSLNCPVIVVLNKVDEIDDQARLLPFVREISSRLPGAECLPVSAKNGDKVDTLVDILVGLMPESPTPIYPEDQVTDRSMRFLASEIVREKVVRLTGAELPYKTAVEIEEFKEENNLLRVSALVLTEREGQKRIVIGEKGARIKQIGIDARRDMEELFGSKVMLNIWVKVKSGWSDDDRALRSLGFDED